MYGWEEAFDSAMIEKDGSRLPERIDAAQTALNRRLQELNGQDSPEERRAIQNAQLGLNLLKAEVSSNNGRSGH